MQAVMGVQYRSGSAVTVLHVQPGPPNFVYRSRTWPGGINAWFAVRTVPRRKRRARGAREQQLRR